MSAVPALAIAISGGEIIYARWIESKTWFVSAYRLGFVTLTQAYQIRVN